MRQVVSGRVHQGLRAVALLIAMVAVAASAAPASAAAASPTPGSATLTAALSASSVVYGAEVKVAGSLEPAAEGQEVVVRLGGAQVGSGFTGADGAYEVAFTARRSGEVVAALTADAGVTGAGGALAVKPKVSVSHGALVPFVRSKLVVKVAPPGYDGVVVLKVVHRKATAGTYKARCRSGRAVFRVPLRGVDAFQLRFVLPAADGLAGRSLQTKVAVRARTLSMGAKGPYVKGMLTGLQRLRFRVPGMGSVFSTQVKDSVVAFQKAYGLKRTYVFNTACWRKLDGAKLIKARRSTPATHIEVDKGRQILMIVKNGKPWGIIAVSTGATGNTPEGTFRIQQKHSSTSSGFGGTLVRTMGFLGDFAIHGWVDVPPYPASHGCVREPIWVCYWTYDNSWVGETVYVYR